MPRRLIRSIAAAAARKSRERDLAAHSHFEQLESRILFSATGPAFIQDIVADNRGLITMEVCGDLDSDTLNENSVQVFTAGADNLFGTFDDVVLDSTFTYNQSTGLLRIDGNVDADTRYGVRLDASIIRGENGFLLDGEFNGADMPTGDGLSGGDMLFYTKTAATQIARIATVLGNIDIELFTAETPLSVMNFLNYANSGRYDDVIFHRMIEDFVAQAGGFEDRFGFDEVVKDDPVVNEPGISNTRGTIAFAKTPNNPDSATSEWFLNFSDNSENLDNQNGGFTVFGEITDQAGLDVLDAIGALDTVDASGVDSAFSDFPVTNIDALNGNPAAITPAVSVGISRVSVIQELSATPPEQLQAESFTFQSNRDVFVTVYDLGGIGRDELDDVIDVKFSSNRVDSITITGDFPAGSLGIVIGDANRVGTIKDKSDTTSVAFIFSNAEIGNIKLKGDITGHNINGLNLGGILLSDDVDADGVFDDETAILINSGYTNAISSTGDITGDILAPGGVGSLQLRGNVTDSNIRIGASPAGEEAMKVQIGTANRTSFETVNPIQSMQVDNWTVDTGSDNTTINAPSIGSLKLNGAFDADVTLTGAAEPETETLGKLLASTGLFGSTFDITGDIGSIVVKGDTAMVDIATTGGFRTIKLEDVLNTTIVGSQGGEVTSVKVGAVSDSTLDFDQNVNNFKAESWDGGSLTLPFIRNLKVTDRDGVFNPDVQFGRRGFPSSDDLATNITINAEITGGVWSANGNIKKISIRDGQDAEILIMGSLDTFTAGDLTRFDLAIQQDSQKVTAGTWFRGDLAINRINNMQINGDFRADISSVSANRINITGDVFIADLFFSQQPDIFGTYGIRSLTVGGEMRDVEFRAAFRVGTITAKAMHNTIIGVSNNIPNDDFPPAQNVDPFASIESVILTGSRNSGPNFTDSYIIASTIDEVVLGGVDPFNFGHEYGVGAFEIGSLTYSADGEEITLRNNALSASPEPFGDFEVRIGFIRFQDVSG